MAIKIGVREGGGPPPGYRWNVAILLQAFDEAMSFLNRDQYHHVARKVRLLAGQDDPTHSHQIDIRPIEDYHELRDKGGILGRINARAFYFVHASSRTSAILGAINKNNDGQTPTVVKINMRRRIAYFLETRESEPEGGS